MVTIAATMILAYTTILVIPIYLGITDLKFLFLIRMTVVTIATRNSDLWNFNYINWE